MFKSCETCALSAKNQPSGVSQCPGKKGGVPCTSEDNDLYAWQPIEKKEKDMSVKLKYSLWQEGNVVKFQIHEMDKRFRGSGWGYFTASNGYKVNSYDYPELSGTDIFLHGVNTEKDYIIAEYEANSFAEAAEYIANVHKALAEWAEKWEGWRKPVVNVNTKTNQYLYII